MAAKTLVVDLGGERYVVERDWLHWPEGAKRGFISDVAVALDGGIFVAQRNPAAVLRFGGDGRFQGTIDAPELIDPHGISVAEDGTLYVVDRDAHEVVAFSTDGAATARFGRRHQPCWKQPFNHPTDACRLASGEVAVTDGYGNSRVHVFGADGVLKHSWGEPGTGPGGFSTPHAIAGLADGRILVADRENNRVQMFDGAGKWLDDWLGLYHPMDVHVLADGRILVSDQVPRLHLFAADGRLLGRCRGAINGAHGLSSDREGNLYLAELPPASVTRLTLQA